MGDPQNKNGGVFLLLQKTPLFRIRARAYTRIDVSFRLVAPVVVASCKYGSIAPYFAAGILHFKPE